MKDRRFLCYRTSTSYLGGKIENDRLRIESNVYGDGDRYPYDVEAIYDLSEEMTRRLFGIITLENFIALCAEKCVTGMERFLDENDIKYEKFTWWSDN